MATRKLEKQSRPAAEPRDRAASVFLNIPYDAAFENLLLAYIAGISAFGFTPRAGCPVLALFARAGSDAPEA